MARCGNSSKASREQPEVKFSIEIRSASSTQIEAGKRMFSRLIARAQNALGQSATAKAWAQAVAEAPPAVDIKTNEKVRKSPLTN